MFLNNTKLFNQRSLITTVLADPEIDSIIVFARVTQKRGK